MSVVFTSGIECRTIPLSRGQEAIVSVEDYDKVSKLKWYASYARCTKGFYAYAYKSRREKISMHRFILGLGVGDKRECDHISMNTLDNRRENLRIATRSENGRNKRKPSSNTSGFKGVSFHKSTGKWQAYIGVDKKMLSLGLYPSAEEAYYARCEAAKAYHGEFARLS